MSLARSETDGISNRAEDGHAYAACRRRKWKSPTKEKAKDKAFGSDFDGAGIGSLSLTEPDHSPCNSEELGSDVDEELPGG
ncbi:hypothetical protein CASFOL_041964 [Castilleja foliolosa]|uniref:Uncharacterized protein n=1 Tax=Castilleja foliolosa TaxID=1961234 RepID=A0ABD3B964_9LAMI